MTTYTIVNDKKEIVAATTSEERAYELVDHWNDKVGFIVHKMCVDLPAYHSPKNQVVIDGNHDIEIHHEDGSLEIVTGCSKFSSTERALARIASYGYAPRTIEAQKLLA